MSTCCHLDGSLSVSQRCLQSVGPVSVLSGLLLCFLQLIPQLGQRALQGGFLRLELLAKLNLDKGRKSHKKITKAGKAHPQSNVH